MKILAPSHICIHTIVYIATHICIHTIVYIATHIGHAMLEYSAICMYTRHRYVCTYMLRSKMKMSH